MKKASKRSRRRRGDSSAESKETSLPTGRYAYVQTRRWLLGLHGPICAYCAVRYDEDTMTLDHVSPRRGLTAYDRRDNLVLCCKRCNSAKADKPFVSYILAQPKRATNLLHFGSHLSEGILEIVRPLAGPGVPVVTGSIGRVVYGPGDDADSPYLDSPYSESA